MKELYYKKATGLFTEKTEDIKFSFVEGVVTEAEITDGYICARSPVTEELFFKIGFSIPPEVTLTFRPHIRLDIGEKVRVYLSDSKRAIHHGYLEVAGIQILADGKVKFQAKRCADYIFK